MLPERGRDQNLGRNLKKTENRESEVGQGRGKVYGVPKRRPKEGLRPASTIKGINLYRKK